MWSHDRRTGTDDSVRETLRRFSRRRNERLLARYDANDDKDTSASKAKNGNHGNTRLPYGLAKGEGIDTEGMEPKEVWKALEGKGYSPKKEYEKLEQRGKKDENSRPDETWKNEEGTTLSKKDAVVEARKTLAGIVEENDRLEEEKKRIDKEYNLANYSSAEYKKRRDSGEVSSIEELKNIYEKNKKICDDIENTNAALKKEISDMMQTEERGKRERLANKIAKKIQKYGEKFGIHVGDAPEDAEDFDFYLERVTSDIKSTYEDIVYDTPELGKVIQNLIKYGEDGGLQEIGDERDKIYSKLESAKERRKKAEEDLHEARNQYKDEAFSAEKVERYNKLKSDYEREKEKLSVEKDIEKKIRDCRLKLIDARSNSFELKDPITGEVYSTSDDEKVLEKAEKKMSELQKEYEEILKERKEFTAAEDAEPELADYKSVKEYRAAVTEWENTAFKKWGSHEEGDKWFSAASRKAKKIKDAVEDVNFQMYKVENYYKSRVREAQEELDSALKEKNELSGNMESFRNARREYHKAVKERFPEFEDCETKEEIEERIDAEELFADDGSQTCISIDETIRTITPFVNLTKKYPSLKGKLGRITIKKISEDVYGYSYGRLHSSIPHVSLNEKYYKDHKILEESMDECEKSGYHPKGVGTDGVIIHEYGHQMDYILGRTGYKYFSNEVMEKVCEKFGIESEEARTRVSRYAEKGAHNEGYGLEEENLEFFAEAWSEYICSEHPRDIAMYVGHLTEERIRELFPDDDRSKRTDSLDKISTSAIKAFHARRKERLSKRFDADDDSESNKPKSEGHGNTHLPYGIAKGEGINTEGMTPREVWDALKEKGYNPKEEYEKLKERGEKKEEKTKEEIKEPSKRDKVRAAKEKYNQLNNECKRLDEVRTSTTEKLENAKRLKKDYEDLKKFTKCSSIEEVRKYVEDAKAELADIEKTNDELANDIFEWFKGSRTGRKDDVKKEELAKRIQDFADKYNVKPHRSASDGLSTFLSEVYDRIDHKYIEKTGIVYRANDSLRKIEESIKESGEDLGIQKFKETIEEANSKYEETKRKTEEAESEHKTLREELDKEFATDENVERLNKLREEYKPLRERIGGEAKEQRLVDSFRRSLEDERKDNFELVDPRNRKPYAKADDADVESKIDAKISAEQKKLDKIKGPISELVDALRREDIEERPRARAYDTAEEFESALAKWNEKYFGKWGTVEAATSEYNKLDRKRTMSEQYIRRYESQRDQVKRRAKRIEDDEKGLEKAIRDKEEGDAARAKAETVRRDYHEAVKKRFPEYDDCRTGEELGERIDADELFIDDGVKTSVGNDETIQSIKPLLKLMKKFPGIKGKLRHLEIGTMPYGYSGAYGVSNGSRVTLNEEFYRDLSVLEKRMKHDVDDGFHPAGVDGRLVVIHEYGHQLDRVLREGGKYKYFSNEVMEAVCDKLGISEEEARSQVSGYSTQGQYNPGYGPEERNLEFFAEAWSEYICSEHPREVAMLVGQMTEERIRKKFPGTEESKRADSSDRSISDAIKAFYTRRAERLHNRFDADGDEETNNKRKEGGHGNTRLPYGIAKGEGIDTTGMEPKEVWDALKGKGYSPKEEYRKLKERGEGKEQEKHTEAKEQKAEVKASRKDNAKNARKRYLDTYNELMKLRRETGYTIDGDIEEAKKNQGEYRDLLLSINGENAEDVEKFSNTAQSEIDRLRGIELWKKSEFYDSMPTYSSFRDKGEDAYIKAVEEWKEKLREVAGEFAYDRECGPTMFLNKTFDNIRQRRRELERNLETAKNILPKVKEKGNDFGVEELENKKKEYETELDALKNKLSKVREEYQKAKIDYSEELKSNVDEKQYSECQQKFRSLRDKIKNGGFSEDGKEEDFRVSVYEKALEEAKKEIKDIVDPETGEVLSEAGKLLSEEEYTQLRDELEKRRKKVLVDARPLKEELSELWNAISGTGQPSIEEYYRDRDKYEESMRKWKQEAFAKWGSKEEAEERYNEVSSKVYEYNERASMYGFLETTLHESWARAKSAQETLDRGKANRDEAATARAEYKKARTEYHSLIKKRFPDFDDCETKEELGERVDAEEMFDSDGFKTSLDNDIAIRALQPVVKMLDKYPAVKGKMSHIEIGHLDRWDSDNVYGQSGRHKVELNEDYYGNEEKFDKSYAESIRTGFHPIGTSKHSVIIHEYGHQLDRLLARDKKKDPFFSNEVMKAAKAHFKMSYDEIRKGVSGYSYEAKDKYKGKGMTNLEFFAEAWSEYITSDSPRDIALFVGHMVEERLKELYPDGGDSKRTDSKDKQISEAVRNFRTRRAERISMRLDADDDGNENKPKKSESHGNTRLPYGLAKGEGIDTEGMKPKEVWEALEGKGYSPKEEYQKLKERGEGKTESEKNSGTVKSDELKPDYETVKKLREELIPVEQRFMQLSEEKKRLDADAQNARSMKDSFERLKEKENIETAEEFKDFIRNAESKVYSLDSLHDSLIELTMQIPDKEQYKSETGYKAALTKWKKKVDSKSGEYSGGKEMDDPEKYLWGIINEASKSRDEYRQDADDAKKVLLGLREKGTGFGLNEIEKKQKEANEKFGKAEAEYNELRSKYDKLKGKYTETLRASVDPKKYEETRAEFDRAKREVGRYTFDEETASRFADYWEKQLEKVKNTQIQIIDDETGKIITDQNDTDSLEKAEKKIGEIQKRINDNEKILSVRTAKSGDERKELEKENKRLNESLNKYREGRAKLKSRNDAIKMCSDMLNDAVKERDNGKIVRERYKKCRSEFHSIVRKRFPHFDDCDTAEELQDRIDAEELFKNDGTTTTISNEKTIRALNPVLKLIEKYPRLKGKLGHISIKTLGSRTYGQSGSVGVELNDTFFGDEKKFKESHDHDIMTGFHPNIEDPVMSTVMHEYGHQIDDVLSKDGMHLFSNEVMRKVCEHFSIEEDTARGMVSGYAVSAASKLEDYEKNTEFFAEAWSEYISSDNPREIALFVGHMVEERLKELYPDDEESKRTDSVDKIISDVVRSFRIRRAERLAVKPAFEIE